MALKANATTPTYLHPPLFAPQIPCLPSLTRYHRQHRNIRLRCQSSLVDEQKEVVSFSEPENSLIEALIGIQGRGRSVSSQQLSNVERAVNVLEGLEGVRDPISPPTIRNNVRDKLFFLGWLNTGNTTRVTSGK